MAGEFRQEGARSAMRTRQHVAGVVVLGLAGCWGALFALHQEAAWGQTGKKPAQPVQFPPTTQEPPLADTKPLPPPQLVIPQPPPQLPVIPQQPLLVVPPPGNGNAC